MTGELREYQAKEGGHSKELVGLKRWTRRRGREWKHHKNRKPLSRTNIMSDEGGRFANRVAISTKESCKGLNVYSF